MGRLCQILRGLGRDARGIAALEMAVVAPVLLVLLAVSIDFGRFFSQSLELTNAVKAGAQYAFTDSGSEARIDGVIRDALPDHLQAATRQVTCYCGAPTNVVACSYACPDGSARTMTLRAEVNFTSAGITLPGRVWASLGMNPVVSNVTIRHQ